MGLTTGLRLRLVQAMRRVYGAAMRAAIARLNRSISSAGGGGAAAAPETAG